MVIRYTCFKNTICMLKMKERNEKSQIPSSSTTSEKLLLNYLKKNNCDFFFAILAILHLRLLRYFPSTKLVDPADNCYTSLYFYFSSFSMFIRSRISKLVVICSCCSFLFFPLIYLFHPTLFYSSFYSLFCFLPLFIHFIF